MKRGTRSSDTAERVASLTAHVTSDVFHEVGAIGVGLIFGVAGSGFLRSWARERQE